MATVAIVTLGCPKNQVDSEAIASILEESGYELVSDSAQADFVIVNTCGFIAPAREESLGELRALAEAKRPGQRLVAAGCLAELNPSLLMQAVPELDALLSTRRWHEVGKLLAELGGPRRSPVARLGDSSTPTRRASRRPTGATAYIKIADGCDGPCAFCTIPRIKGPYVSRPRAEIVAEAGELVATGCKELILIAQDTTGYGRERGERDALPGLIETVLEEAPALRWLRLMYAYPRHVSDRLLEVMAARPQVCHYLDLPLQHAHAEVLRRMRRPADADDILSLIGRARAAMPDLVLRTAFIVGYPGESEAEFEYLLEFLREVRFDHVGAFAYSREEGTPAGEMEPQVPEEIKTQRRDRLLEVQQQVSLERNRAQLGRELAVLVEGAGDGVSVGRTYRDAPEVDGLALLVGEREPGEMVPCRVTRATEYDLFMVPLDGVPRARGTRRRSPRRRRAGGDDGRRGACRPAG